MMHVTDGPRRATTVLGALYLIASAVTAQTAPRPTIVKVEDPNAHGVASHLYRVGSDTKEVFLAETDPAGNASVQVRCDEGVRVLARPLDPTYLTGSAKCAVRAIRIQLTSKKWVEYLRANATILAARSDFQGAAFATLVLSQRLADEQPQAVDSLKRNAHMLFGRYLGVGDVPIGKVSDKGWRPTPAFSRLVLVYQQSNSLPVTGRLDSLTLATSTRYRLVDLGRAMVP